MPYVESSGVQIHYEVEGSGPAVVFEHGITDALDSFYEAGYVEGLQDDYRLVFIDARGHGKSGSPHDSAAYLTEQRVADVLAVMDAERVDKAVYYGFSLGGITGFTFAHLHPERLRGVIICGMHARSRRLVRGFIEEQARAFREMGIQEVLEERDRQRGPLSPGRRERFLALDPLAIAAAWEAVGEWDGVEEALPTMATPALIIVGDHDTGYRETAPEDASRMPNARFVSMPGLDHVQTFDRTDLVLPHIKEFLSRVS